MVTINLPSIKELEGSAEEHGAHAQNYPFLDSSGHETGHTNIEIKITYVHQLGDGNVAGDNNSYNSERELGTSVIEHLRKENRLLFELLTLLNSVNLDRH